MSNFYLEITLDELVIIRDALRVARQEYEDEAEDMINENYHERAAAYFDKAEKVTEILDWLNSK